MFLFSSKEYIEKLTNSLARAKQDENFSLESWKECVITELKSDMQKYNKRNRNIIRIMYIASALLAFNVVFISGFPFDNNELSLSNILIHAPLMTTLSFAMLFADIKLCGYRSVEAWIEKQIEKQK